MSLSFVTFCCTILSVGDCTDYLMKFTKRTKYIKDPDKYLKN